MFKFSARLGKISASLTAGAILVYSGCSSSTRARPEWVQTIAFWDKEEVDKAYQGHIPAKRVEVLREEALKMSTLSAAEQQAKAELYAKAYREEADPFIKSEIVKAIATCGSPLAADTIKDAMRDGNRDVRIVACDAWAVHGGPLAVPQLSEAIRKDASIDVRLAAVRCLGKIGGPEAIAALGPALEDPDPALQYRAVQSMRLISGKDFGDDANAWREFAKGGQPAEISVTQRAKLDLF